MRKIAIILGLTVLLPAYSCKKTLDLKNPNSTNLPTIDAARAGLVNVVTADLSRVNALVAENTFIANNLIVTQSTVGSSDIRYPYTNLYQFVLLNTDEIYRKATTIDTLEARFLFWLGNNMLYQQFEEPMQYEVLGQISGKTITKEYLENGVNQYIATSLQYTPQDTDATKAIKNKFVRLSYFLLLKLAMDEADYVTANNMLLELGKDVDGTEVGFSNKYAYSYEYLGTAPNDNNWVRYWLGTNAISVDAVSLGIFNNPQEKAFLPLPMEEIKKVKYMRFFNAQQSLEILGEIEFNFIKAELLARTGGSADDIKTALEAGLKANAERTKNTATIDLAHITDFNLNEVKRLKYKVFFGHYAFMADLRRWENENPIIFSFINGDGRGDVLKARSDKGFPKKYKYIIGG
jgi:hypothetical protein